MYEWLFFSFVMVRLDFLFLTLQNQKVISELTIYYLPWNSFAQLQKYQYRY